MPVDNPVKPDNTSSGSILDNFGIGDDPFGLAGGGDGNVGDQSSTDGAQQNNSSGKGLRDHYDDAKKLRKKLRGEDDGDDADGDGAKDREKPGEGKGSEEPGQGPKEGGAGEKPAESGAGEGTGTADGKMGGQGVGEGPTGGGATGEAGMAGEGAAEVGGAEAAGNAAGSSLSTAGTAGNAAGTSAATTGTGAAGSAGGAAAAGGKAAATTAGAAGNATSAAATTAGAAGNAALTGGALATEVGAEAGAAITGVGLPVAAALAIADVLNRITKKITKLLGLDSKDLTKMGAGLMILLTMMITMGISSIGFGAINGDGGKTGQVAVAEGSSETKSVLDAMNQTAKSNVSLTGSIGIPGLPGGGNIGGEKAGELKNNFGFSIAKYKRLQFSSRDKDFINNILKNGFDPKHHSGMDRRLIDALVYLANRHGYIKVSNIVYQYEDMPVDFENTSKAQVAANISAHTSGQAADIREVDFIYEGVDPISCTTDPKDTRRDLVWFNDQGKELLRQRCQGNLLKPFFGGPIIRAISTKAFPIQIAWQDDAPKKSGGLSGTTRGNATSLIERGLKLPAGSLDRSNGNNPLEQIGLAEIAQQINIDPVLVNGKNSNELSTNIGEGTIEKSLNLATGSLKGTQLSDIISQTGRSSVEKILDLPFGSLKGADLLSIAQSIGKTTIEKEFGFPEGTLGNKDLSRNYMAGESLSQNNIFQIAETINMPKDLISKCIEDAKKGIINSDAIASFGAKRLEKSLLLADGTLDKYIQAVKNKQEIDPKTVVGDLANLIDLEQIKITVSSKEFVISDDKIKSLFSNIGYGENVDDNIQTIGGSQLDNAFALEPGTTRAYSQSGDGDPMEQLDLSSNELMKNAGKALFENNFEGYLRSYGQQYLLESLQDGPNNLTILISDDQKNQLLTNPMATVEQIGSAILKRNLNLSDEVIAKLKGSQVQKIPAITSTMNNLELSDQDISVIPATDFTAMSTVQGKIMDKFSIGQDDYAKFITGNFATMSIIQEEVGKLAGVSQNAIAKLVSKNYKKVPEIRTVLKNEAGYSDEKIDGTNNSVIAEIPQIKAKLSSILQFNGNDWESWKSGGILSTNLFKKATASKLGCTKDDSDKIKSGGINNVTSVKSAVKGLKLSGNDWKTMSQGIIKAMPTARNAIKSAFNLTDDSLDKLYSGDISGISTVAGGLASKFNVSGDDLNKLLARDFTNLDFTRKIMSDKLQVANADLDKILQGDIGHVPLIQNALAAKFNVSADAIGQMIDGKFKNATMLKQVAINTFGLSKDQTDKIGAGIIQLNPTESQAVKNILLASGKANEGEVGSIMKGDWLGSGAIKTDLAGKLNIDVSDVEVIKMGQMSTLPIVQDTALEKFDLNQFGLDNLTKGKWGEIPIFQEKLGGKLNLDQSDITNLISGNIPNISQVQDLFKQDFNISNLDLQNLTGKYDLSNIPSLNDFSEAFSMSTGQIGGFLGGGGNPTDMISFGGSLGGGGLVGLGGGEAEVMNKVKRPEARRKVHQVINELLDIAKNLNDRNFSVTQLITFSKGRDVDPFESKLEKIYGKSKENGGTRAENYGLFSMKEAHPNLHIGY